MIHQHFCLAFAHQQAWQFRVRKHVQKPMEHIQGVAKVYHSR
jgi:hypothetical protein